MKPMTEEEARAAIKEACPWASDRGVYPPTVTRKNWCAWVVLSPRSGLAVIQGNGPTLRSAVSALIRTARMIGAAK